MGRRAQVAPQAATPLPSFTGPGANPYWNGVNPFVSYPQKLPLLRITDQRQALIVGAAS